MCASFDFASLCSGYLLQAHGLVAHGEDFGFGGIDVVAFYSCMHSALALHGHADDVFVEGADVFASQIFIDGHHVGGSDELAALDARGGLDPLLGRTSG